MINANNSKYRFGRSVVASTNTVAIVVTLFMKMRTSKGIYLYFQVNAIL